MSGDDASRDLPGHADRQLYSATRMNKSDVLLTIYFLGMALSGAEGLLHPGELGSMIEEMAGMTVATAFSWAMVATGLSGVAARLADSRMGEFYAIIAISALTVINGIALLPEHPQTTIRLVFAPAMMIPYGWMRLGWTVSRTQVTEIQKTVIEERKRSGEQ